MPEPAVFLLHAQDSESQSKVVGPEPQYLDEFTSLLVPDDTRVMVDLLKLAVSCRSGEKGKEVLSAVLSGMGTAYPQVGDCTPSFDPLCGRDVKNPTTCDTSGSLSCAGRRHAAGALCHGVGGRRHRLAERPSVLPAGGRGEQPSIHR